jgi:hypothetical protein
MRAFTEIESTGPCSHAQHRRKGEDSHLQISTHASKHTCKYTHMRLFTRAAVHTHRPCLLPLGFIHESW